MRSSEVASLCSCSERYIRKATKQALESGVKNIEIKGFNFVFDVLSNTSGKVYAYTQVVQKSQKQKSVKTIGFKLIDEELSGFDVSKTSFTTDEKVLIIAFYRKYNYSLNTIIKALYVNANIYPDSKKIASFAKKVERWVEAFKNNGVKALEDKRGTVASNVKINQHSLERAVTGAGSRGIRDNFYGAWELYNYLESKKEGVLDAVDFNETHSTRISHSKSYISYTAFIKAIKRLYNSNPQIRSFIVGGKDMLGQDFVVGIKDVGYINQEWQVDSTKFDFMCRIPVNDKNGYRVGRVNVTAVIDVFTKKAVATLTESIDSYAQVRVLHKAIERFGLPESVYTDNGRDYVSNHYTRLLQDLGVSQIKAKVGMGRQKGAIERFFGVTQSDWASLPGYVGNDVEKRTKIENQTASKIDIRTSKATRVNPEKLLWLDELRTVVENLLHISYQNFDEFEEFRCDEEQLLQIHRRLGKSKTVTLQTTGVRFNNFTYQSANIWLKGLNRGQKVEVYENIDNVNEVFIFLNNEFVTTALNIELGAKAMNMEEHKESVKAYKKNNIAPMLKIIKDGEIAYEQMQEFKLKQVLEQRIEMPPVKKSETVNKPNEPDITDELFAMSQKLA